MAKILNFIKNKIVIYSLIMNCIFLFVFFYSIMDETGGWGNIELFITLIFLYPILIFLINFVFYSFNEKIKFTYLSFLIFFIVFITQFNLLSLNLSKLIKLIGVITLPLIIVYFQHVLYLIFKKVKRNNQ